MGDPVDDLLGSLLLFPGISWVVNVASFPAFRDLLTPRSPSPTDRLRVKHIPIIAQDPTKCRELAIDHAPLEIIPWAEVLLAVATLNIS